MQIFDVSSFDIRFIRTIFVAFLSLICLAYPASSQQVEATTPNVTMSVGSILGESYPDNSQTFYNPTGIQIGDSFHFLVQVASGDEFSSDDSFCWGDQIVHFTAEMSYEGLRSTPQLIGRISPCSPCTDLQCSYEDRFMWGLGGLFKSSLDGAYFVGVEYAKGDNVLVGDFKEIRLMRSVDGFSWNQVLEPGSEEPVKLVSQSNLSCQAETGPCSGPCAGGNAVAQGESCLLFQFLDLNLLSEQDHWWGYVRFVVSTTSYLAKIRIFPDDPSPGEFRVELLAKDDTWKRVGASGEIDFLPKNLWRDGFVNALIESPSGCQVWASEYAPSAVGGCDDGNNSPASTSRFAYREVDAERNLGSVHYLGSRSRPAETINSTGRLMPLPVRDPDGSLMLFSASSDRVCEAFPSWPPGGNTYVGMDIVQTEITDAWIRDGFSATSSRPEGSSLDGSTTELGNETWTALGTTPGLVIRDGTATDDGAVDTRAANIPFSLSDYPDTAEIVVRGRVGATGSQWVGFGLNSTHTSPLLSTGQVWVLIRPNGSWELVGEGQTLSSGTVSVDPEAISLELAYEIERRRVDLRIDGVSAANDVALPMSFTPTLEAIGFQFFDPLPDQPGDNTLDRFEVALPTQSIFTDGFESGNRTAWSSETP